MESNSEQGSRVSACARKQGANSGYGNGKDCVRKYTNTPSDHNVTNLITWNEGIQK
jgi:hypothetical protein